MSDLLAKDLVAYDPLSEVTRRERRALLGLSVVSIALVKVPLVPDKIAALGIDFTLRNQQNFLAVFAAILVYFLIAFLMYAATDYVAWRRGRVIAHQQYTQQWVSARHALGKEGEERLVEELQNERELGYRGLASYKVARAVARARAAFEFLVPLLAAGYAIHQLLAFGP